MDRRKFLKGIVISGMAVAALRIKQPGHVLAQGPKPPVKKKKITPVDRRAAAQRLQAQGIQPGVAMAMAMPAPDQGAVPHYFGPYANYANSPLPTGQVFSISLDNGGSGYTAPEVVIGDVYGTGSGATAHALFDAATGVITDIVIDNNGSGYSAPVVTINDPTGADALASATIGGALSGGIRKFMDRVPGLGIGSANGLGQYIPVAVPDTTTYTAANGFGLDADYYEIELGEYTEQLHSDLPPTTLRGYRQVNASDPAVTKFHYLGPLIVARRDRPVRIKFTNSLPTATGGDLFLPVDASVMGAGMGPLGMNAMPMNYTQNRATLHMHGALIPWISDGTPHQWVTPVGENTPYPKGVSVHNVPDMPDPGDGSLTFYYNNEQSARLMFYHDHSFGITRLNVYAGEAAGYLLTDKVEDDLINGTNLTGVNPSNLKVLPDLGIPLILQDRTFVDQTTILAQDPTWRWGTGAVDPNTGFKAPKTGDLWLASVYMTAQNPWDLTGGNAYGRWQYGPWFWPPTTDITHPPVPNEYYQPDPALPNYAPWEPPMRPDVPSPSMGMEAFMDTPLVNGTVYPFMEVDPKAYRFRILNAADDRFFNLHFYVADPAVVTSDGRVNTEVKMVPAMKTAGYPNTWSTDGREGGVPDPFTAGPAWIQIGTEGGFLPAPVVINTQPVNWNMNATAFNFGNVTDHSLLLGCAERADVIVDFTPYAGQTLILYNDAPTAFPALDPRYDYYTGNPSQMDTGGAPTTQPGFGPNTRTVMQIRVSGTPSGAVLPNNYYDAAQLAALKSVFAKTATKPSVFEVSQDSIIVPQAAYNNVYGGNFPSTVAGAYVNLFDTQKTFTPIGTTTPVTIPFEEKAAHDEMGAAYDTEYGRMGGMMGIELLNTTNLTQNIILYGFTSPPVDIMSDSISPLGTAGDGTQIWKITHNGVDTHPVHFHLFNVQVINRVAWDGVLLPPEPNELGWKETVRMNPLENLIVAMRPVKPKNQPFEIPNSVRLIDPTMPEGAALMTPPGGFVDPGLNRVTVLNHKVNYGWEYVWHCHILSHEEMDMMHALSFAVNPKAPTGLGYTILSGNKGIRLSFTDNSINETGFLVQRAKTAAGPWTTLTTLPEAPGKGAVMSYTDATFRSSQIPFYYRVIATNVVGDTFNYGPNTIGFPTKVANSDPVLVGPPLGTTTLNSVTQAITTGAPVIVSWSYVPGGDQTSYTIQRATNATFTSGLTTFTAAGTATTFSDGTNKSAITYYYRVRAGNALGSGAWSNTVSILAHK